MDLMTIGAFAGRTRLSAKALRLYDRLGLLPPARVDPDSGYRFYSEDQVATARLIALLRRLGMPLPAIADIAAQPPAAAAAAVGAYWSDVESATADRRILASYIQAKLTGGDMPSYDITTRAIPRRTILSISRHLHGNETKAFFAQQTARLQVVQLPTYSPDYNPIEKLWKKIKQQETHLHYFPTFEALTNKVEQALLKFANRPEEILALCSLPTELAQAA